MAKAKIIYEDRPVVFAKYHHPRSDDAVNYQSTIQIKDSGKQPITMKLQFDDVYPAFAPMPPEEHTIKAKDLVELYLKLKRWLGKFGYELK